MTAPSISELPQRLRAALVMTGFTYDAVAEVLGPEAHAALARNETTPGLRRTGGGWPLETLIRLFLLQAPVE
ncbi:MAG TPA: transferase, partial [Marmoricola sp.]